jgi:hypothetical protein
VEPDASLAVGADARLRHRRRLGEESGNMGWSTLPNASVDLAALQRIERRSRAPAHADLDLQSSLRSKISRTSPRLLDVPHIGPERRSGGRLRKRSHFEVTQRTRPPITMAAGGRREDGIWQ